MITTLEGIFRALPLSKSETGTSLRPVTVKQLSKATQPHTDAEWIVDGNEIGQVTLVAHVISIQIQATNRVFWLDDGTGRIEARCWVDSTDAEDEKWTGIVENTYVRVTGGLKMFGNKRYVNALHIRPIKDPHEIFYHILDSITTNLILERGPPTNAGGQTQGTFGKSAYMTESHGIDMGQYADLPPLQRNILKVLVENPTETGHDVEAVMRSLRITDRGQVVVRTAIEELVNQGHAFSTDDEMHFRASVG
ncbi:hypothetical protein AMATHDRAFT_72787 [Amanita thiersii Skay4041]|uniref:OB domain-containing protein n=1 Tax=Amanita thiersii Skay4041 TaxID=703135 RepID=A0A2A9P194_9AGAR|nr:hypothetical protein AMATHDRAFT_72787 [Amanita thiersii Skay4041]